MQVIGYGAFRECRKLNEVYYDLKEGTPVQMDAKCFYHVDEFYLFDEFWFVRINAGLRIYVYDSAAESCKAAWKEKSIANYGGDDFELPALASRIKIRKD